MHVAKAALDTVQFVQSLLLSQNPEIQEDAVRFDPLKLQVAQDD